MDVEGDAARASDMDVVLGALRKIKPEYREVILLRFVEGYSAADVAKLLDKAEKAIWNLQQRGLERLRNELKRSGESALAGVVACAVVASISRSAASQNESTLPET